MELLVAMSLSSVVFIMVGSILAVFVSHNTQNQRQEVFEQVKNDLATELTNNIKWATNVTYGLGYVDADGTEYRADNGNLLKNGTNLLPDRVAVSRFEIIDRSAIPDLVSLEINIELEDRNYPVAKDGLHVVVSQRKTDITF